MDTKYCDVCGETGDTSCFNGGGTCAIENAEREIVCGDTDDGLWAIENAAIENVRQNAATVGVCDVCGEIKSVHRDTIVVGGRVFDDCPVCGDCTLSNDERDVLVAKCDKPYAGEFTATEREIVCGDTVDVCPICGVCPIIYVHPMMVDGMPVCDDCARAHITDVMSGMSETIDAIDAREHAAIIDAHLERYIGNRNRRTQQTWHIVKRFVTDGYGHTIHGDNPVRVRGWGYHRAVIENDIGKQKRIWYDVYKSCWRVS